MKSCLKRSRLLTGLLLLMLAAGVKAQTVATPPPETPPVQHISISGNVGGINSNGTNPTSVVGVAYQLTHDFSAGYMQINDQSASSTWKFGAGNYSRQMCSVLGERLSAKLTFDACAVTLTVQAGLGRYVAPHANHLAGTGGFYVSIPTGTDHLAYTLGVSLLGTSHVIRVFQTGLTLSF